MCVCTYVLWSRDGLMNAVSEELSKLLVSTCKCDEEEAKWLTHAVLS